MLFYSNLQERWQEGWQERWTRQGQGEEEEQGEEKVQDQEWGTAWFFEKYDLQMFTLNRVQYMYIP